jgi:hypothetical protein
VSPSGRTRHYACAKSVNRTNGSAIGGTSAASAFPWSLHHGLAPINSKEVGIALRDACHGSPNRLCYHCLKKEVHNDAYALDFVGSDFDAGGPRRARLRLHNVTQMNDGDSSATTGITIAPRIATSPDMVTRRQNSMNTYTAQQDVRARRTIASYSVVGIKAAQVVLRCT